MIQSNPLYYKKKPCVKMSFDLFFCDFIIDFFLFGKCSTKGAALRKEPHKLLFIIRCVKSNIAGTPSHIFVMVICRGYLPQEFAAAICRRNLPQLFAVAFCRGNLPQLFAVAICRENLPWLFAVGLFCVCKQTFFLCEQILFLYKQIFFN